MNRRRFIGAMGSGVVILATPQLAYQQSATPESTPEATPLATPGREPDPVLSRIPRDWVSQIVASFGETTEAGRQSYVGDAMVYLYAYGFALTDDADVYNLAENVVASHAETDYDEDAPFSLSSPVRVSGPQSGRDSWYWDALLTHESSDDQYAWGAIATVEEVSLQILLGVAWRQSATRIVGRIAEATMDRWPNDHVPLTETPQQTGGLWDALPRLDDLPEGMTVSRGIDVTDRVGN